MYPKSNPIISLLNPSSIRLKWRFRSSITINPISFKKKFHYGQVILNRSSLTTLVHLGWIRSIENLTNRRSQTYDCLVTWPWTSSVGQFNSRNDKDVEVIRTFRWDPHRYFWKHLNSSTLVILGNTPRICEALCHVTQNLHKMSHVTTWISVMGVWIELRLFMIVIPKSQILLPNFYVILMSFLCHFLPFHPDPYPRQSRTWVLPRIKSVKINRGWKSGTFRGEIEPNHSFFDEIRLIFCLFWKEHSFGIFIVYCISWTILIQLDSFAGCF